MAGTTFHVDSYWTALGPSFTVDWQGASAAVQGYITCCGENQVLHLYFVDDLIDAPDAAATEATADSPAVAGLFLSLASMPTYLAMLEQQRPVFACVDAENPARTFLKTNRSAIGRETA